MRYLVCIGCMTTSEAVGCARRAVVLYDGRSGWGLGKEEFPHTSTMHYIRTYVPTYLPKTPVSLVRVRLVVDR